MPIVVGMWRLSCGGRPPWRFPNHQYWYWGFVQDTTASSSLTSILSRSVPHILCLCLEVEREHPRPSLFHPVPLASTNLVPAYMLEAFFQGGAKHVSGALSPTFDAAANVRLVLLLSLRSCCTHAGFVGASLLKFWPEMDSSDSDDSQQEQPESDQDSGQNLVGCI